MAWWRVKGQIGTCEEEISHIGGSPVEPELHDEQGADEGRAPTMDELIKEFIQESSENLDRLDQDFVRWESDPGNLELVKSIFRTIHTIKGTCGFLGFAQLGTMAHAGESLLSRLRDGELALNPRITTVLFQMADAIRQMLHSIETSGHEGERNDQELIQELIKVQRGEAIPVAACELPVCAPPGADPCVTSLGGILVTKGAATASAISLAIQAQERGDPRHLGEILVAQGTVKPQDVLEALQTQQAVRGSTAESTIRVDVNLLEKQMNQVGELVLLRNRLLQIAGDAKERNLNAAVHGLNSVTSELRKNVMKMRMQSVSQLFDKLPRSVRDASKDLGKKVKLETWGGDTELDKTLLEAIKDPVTHILRNAIDHGIEVPEERRAKGKAEEGAVRVRAFQEGGNFHLEIADDGAGIDRERVKQKAVANGLISQAQGERMSEVEILSLVFQAGLSTSERVTEVSGRGVGLDVVKTNVERIGGRAKIESVENQGTTVRLEIPLTLATIQALTVASEKSIFAIPQAALVEMIALDAEKSQKQIERIDGVPVFRFRGKVLPLISLREELKLTDTKPVEGEIGQLVVVRAEGRRIAVLVDSIRNTEEIVIKPLDKRFKKIALYSGAAVLGDGRVALILDIAGLARRVGVMASEEPHFEPTVEERKEENLSVLLLAGPDGERMAIPLENVQRMEEFEPSAIELVGRQEVVQYRGEILRLMRLKDLLEEGRARKRRADKVESSASGGRICAIVIRHEESKNILLQVHRILGIVDAREGKLAPPTREGVRGSLIVQGRVTELLDLKGLLSNRPEWETLPATWQE